MHGDFSPAPAITLKASCGGSADDVQISKADVGVGASFGFAIKTTQGADFDLLPDSGEDSYTLSAVASLRRLHLRRLRPGRPRLPARRRLRAVRLRRRRVAPRLHRAG